MKIVGPPLEPWIRYMDRLSNEPTAKTKVKFHSAMRNAFNESQLNVHVAKARYDSMGRVIRQGGRLKQSGKMDAYTRKTARLNELSSEISYGNGLDYAGYEFSRGLSNPRTDWIRHPGHDPLDSLGHHFEVIDHIIDGIF